MPMDRKDFCMHKLLLDLPDSLATDRLIVRRYCAGDGPTYFRLCQNNKEHLLPFEEGNPALSINTVEDAEILMRQFAVDWSARAIFFFGVWEKTTDQLVAQIVLMVVDWSVPQFSLGYFVDKDQQGKGYITEASKAVLEFAFDHLGAARVSAECNELNTRSWQVMERCGMIREGHLRQNKPHLTREDGTRSGDYLYAILRSEFEALR
jgi:RimJ/RimL family protein N-acetyltransferase